MLFDYLRKPTAFILVLLTVILSGLWAAGQLPIKMYPNLIKPSIWVSIGNEDISSSTDLYAAYGVNIEPQLKKIKHLDKFKATY